MHKVRAAFRQEGFGLPDAFARLAAGLCDGAFTSEEFAAEADHKRERILTQGENHFEHPRIVQVWLDRMKAVGPHEAYERFTRPLAIARNEELERAVEPVEPRLRLAKDVKAYAESTGKESGYTLKRDGKVSDHFKRAMVKRMPRTGLVGAFSMDAGGRPSFTMRPNGAPVFFTSMVGLYFWIGLREPAGYSGATTADWLMPGLEQYDRIDGLARGARAWNDLRGPADLDLVSRQAKLGVRAQIRFFDLLLAEIDSGL
jgi:hypothetical protein